jgi:hypothetical protein
VCAAFAARHNTSPRSVDVREVQRELVRQGASLRNDLIAEAATTMPQRQAV